MWAAIPNLLAQGLQYRAKGSITVTSYIVLLYKNGLEQGYFDDMTTMKNALYKNLFKLAMETNAIADLGVWLQNLPDSRISTAMRTYCMALLRFNTATCANDYAETINIATNIAFDDIFDKLDLNCLLLRAYYKINDQRFHTFKNTFLVALRRAKIDKDKHDAYKNFANFCIALSTLRTKNAVLNTEIIHLENRITDTIILYNREWILFEIKIFIRYKRPNFNTVFCPFSN